MDDYLVDRKRVYVGAIAGAAGRFYHGEPTRSVAQSVYILARVRGARPSPALSRAQAGPITSNSADGHLFDFVFPAIATLPFIKQRRSILASLWNDELQKKVHAADPEGMPYKNDPEPMRVYAECWST